MKFGYKDLGNGWTVPYVAESEPCTSKKEKDMYAQTAANVTVTTAPAVKDDAKDYLLRRIRDVRDTKIEDIRDEFRKDLLPKTIKEAKEWLKKGEFRVDFPSYLRDDTPFCEYEYSFSFGKDEPDYVARDKATDAVRAKALEAMDAVTVLTDPEARLKAFKDFEAL